MNKLGKKVIILLLTVVLAAFFLTSCEKPWNDGSDNTGTPSEEEEEKYARLLEEGDNNGLTVAVLLVDTGYSPIADANIYFDGENVGKTDQEGKIPIKVFAVRWDERIFDYISLEPGVYKYSATRYESYMSSTMGCRIVAAPAGSNINIFRYANVVGRVSFHEDGVQLPEGYLSRGEPVRNNKSVNGDTILSRVEFYVGDNLIGVSNEYGFGFGKILVGTRITVKKKGFNFLIRGDGGEIVPLEDDSFIVTANFYDLRGRTNEDFDYNEL